MRCSQGIDLGRASSAGEGLDVMVASYMKLLPNSLVFTVEMRWQIPVDLGAGRQHTCPTRSTHGVGNECLDEAEAGVRDPSSQVRRRYPARQLLGKLDDQIGLATAMVRRYGIQAKRSRVVVGADGRRDRAMVPAA